MCQDSTTRRPGSGVPPASNPSPVEPVETPLGYWQEPHVVSTPWGGRRPRDSSGHRLRGSGRATRTVEEGGMPETRGVQTPAGKVRRWGPPSPLAQEVPLPKCVPYTGPQVRNPWTVPHLWTWPSPTPVLLLRLWSVLVGSQSRVLVLRLRLRLGVCADEPSDPKEFSDCDLSGVVAR